MKKKHKGLRIAIVLIVIVLLAGLGGAGYYLYQQANSGLFFEETTLNGYDVSGMNVSEVFDMLEADYSAPTVTILEGDETALALKLSQMGYTIDETKLLGDIQTCLREQNQGLISSLYQGNTFEVEVTFDFDENVFLSAVTSANFASARTESEDATL